MLQRMSHFKDTFPEVQSLSGLSEPQDTNLAFHWNPKPQSHFGWSVITTTLCCQVEIFIEKLKTQMQHIIQRKVLIP